jgi:uncharacterized membrane protein YgcG
VSGLPSTQRSQRLRDAHFWLTFVAVVVVGAGLSFLVGFVAGNSQPQPAFEPPVAVSPSRLGATQALDNPPLAPLPPLRRREPTKATPAVGGTSSGSLGSPGDGSPVGSGASSRGGSSGGGGDASGPPVKTVPRSSPTETVPAETPPTETVPEASHVSTAGKASK